MRSHVMAFLRMQTPMGRASATTTLDVHTHVVNDEGHDYAATPQLHFASRLSRELGIR